MKEQEEAKRIIEMYMEVTTYTSVVISTSHERSPTTYNERKVIDRAEARQCAIIYVEGKLQELILVDETIGIEDRDYHRLKERMLFLKRVKEIIENYDRIFS